VHSNIIIIIIIILINRDNSGYVILGQADITSLLWVLNA